MCGIETEPELIQRALAGDRDALEQLLLSYYDRLGRRIGRKVPSDLQGLVCADDVLQQTYVRVFRAIHRFKAHSEYSFYGWICTIADRLLADGIKRRRRERLARGQNASADESERDDSARSIVEQVVSRHTAPLRGAIRQEIKRVLPLAMESLPEDQREVLELRYLQELSLEEVAEAMGRTTDAIRGLSHRARKKLHDVLIRLTAYT